MKFILINNKTFDDEKIFDEKSVWGDNNRIVVSRYIFFYFLLLPTGVGSPPNPSLAKHDQIITPIFYNQSV